MRAIEITQERAHPLALFRSRSSLMIAQWIPLASILGIAVALRIQEVARPFIGHHDWHAAFYSFLAAGRCDCAYYNWPPLTEWMYQFSIWAFGPYEWSVRVIPITLSLGTIVIVYALGARLFDKRAGLFGALLLALMPGDAYFARIASFHFFIPLALYLYLLSTESRYRGYLLAGAAASMVFGIGFSYATLPIVAIPAGYLAWRKRDWGGYAVVLLSGLAAVFAWWGYLLAIGQLGKVVSNGAELDGLGKWLDPAVRGSWFDMQRIIVYSNIGPTIASLAALGLVAAVLPQSRGARFVCLWIAAGLGWLILYPVHSSTHDMWWQILYAPIALIAGRGLAFVTDFKGVGQARTAVRVLVLGITAAVFIATGVQLVRDADAGMYRFLSMERGRADEQMGRLLGRFASEDDNVLAPSPFPIWYSGAKGQLYARLYWEEGLDGYEEVLKDGWATYVITHNYRPLTGNRAAWSDTPPYYEGLLQQYGYVPAFGVGDWLALWAKPEKAKIIAAGLSDDLNNLENVRIPYGADGDPLLRDGTIVETPGHALYLIGWGGLKMRFADVSALESYGFSRTEIGAAPGEIVNRMPTGPVLPRLRDGTILRGSTPDLYLIEGGQKRLIPDMATFQALGLKEYFVLSVPDAALASIPAEEPIRSVLRAR